MYSLNAPVPTDVARLAGRLADELPGARARTRDEHTLLVKRLGDPDAREFDPLVARVRETIAGTDPIPVTISGVEYFADPETGTGPVVYLAVESHGLVALHGRLCEAFDPVAHLEGEEYVPHVTIARGGDPALAERLTDREIEPVSFEVRELTVWDAERSLSTTRFSLPA